MRKSLMSCSLLAAAAAFGCASTREATATREATTTREEPAALISAREDVGRLQTDQGAQAYAPEEVAQAQRLLKSAECSQTQGQPEARVNQRACQAKQEAARAQSVAQENRTLAEAQGAAAAAAAESASSEQMRQQAAQEESARQLAAAQQEALRLQEELGFQKTQQGRVLTMAGSTLFAFGSDKLLSNSERKLERVAEVLGMVDEPVVLKGHTDSVGSEDFNRELSERRADSVKEFLVAHGVPAERIDVKAFGEEDPVASNASPEGRALNRRVELVLPQAQEAVGGAGHEKAPAPTQQPGRAPSERPETAPPLQSSPRAKEPQDANPTGGSGLTPAPRNHDTPESPQPPGIPAQDLPVPDAINHFEPDSLPFD